MIQIHGTMADELKGKLMFTENDSFKIVDLPIRTLPDYLVNMNPFLKHGLHKKKLFDQASLLRVNPLKILIYVITYKVNDKVKIEYSEYRSQYVLNKLLYKDAIQELIDMQFIAPTEIKNEYWINPSYL